MTTTQLVYSILVEKLKATQAFANVEWYAQQDSLRNKGNMLVMPAVFIEFRTIRMRSLAANTKEMDLEFRLHILTDNLLINHERIVKPSGASGYDHFALVDVAIKALEGKSGYLSEVPGQEDKAGSEEERRIMGAINLTEQEPEHNNRGIMKTFLTFTSYVKQANFNATFAPPENPIDLVIEDM